MLIANEEENEKDFPYMWRHLDNNFTLGGTNSLLTGINVKCKNTAIP